LMMRYYFSLLALFVFSGAFAQEEIVEKKVVDSLYREDQFYFNASFINVQKSPGGLRQNKISPSFGFGILRDMPINKSRTFSIAAGLGYSINILNDNLYTYTTSDANPTRVYEIISSDIYYSKNKFTTQYLDLPIEIRWRNSTFESHKFWRIYTGFKLSYLISDKYTFVNDLGTTILKHDPNLNKLQYGCYISSGWNSLNVYMYYGLNPIYKSSEVNGQANKMNLFTLGLQFYIL
jgi:hypothetical protein